MGRPLSSRFIFRPRLATSPPKGKSGAGAGDNGWTSETGLQRAITKSLMRSRLPAQLLKQRAQRVELGAEAGPVPGLQPIDRPLIVCERLAGLAIRLTSARRSGRRRERG